MSYLILQAPGLPSRFDCEGNIDRRDRIKASLGEVYVCESWPKFVCLDDPDALAPRGRVRSDDARARAYRFDGLRVRSPKSKVLTQAADGARLVCRNVELRKGQVLTYRWNFLAWGSMPWNDFAGFEMVPDDPADHGQPLEVLCDLAELANRGRKSSGWHEQSWELLHPFRGSLVWIAASGQAVTNPNHFRLSSSAYANPSALLLDDIRVSSH